MNIVVCIKQVPDSETKLKLSGNGIDTAGVKWVMNPFDEFAVEEALTLKKTFPDAKITAMALGPKSRVIDSLRTALAMGCDEATLIDAPETLDNYLTAKALSASIQKMGDLKVVLAGKSAGDDNSFAVGQMVAGFLNIPHATTISNAKYSDSSATVVREVEAGAKETIEVQWPAMLTANKGLNTPRYASLPGIMKAKKKPVQEVTLADLDINESQCLTAYKDFQLPPDRPAVKMLEGEPAEQAKELARLLREEAKVI